jgi:hypothetical protein
MMFNLQTFTLFHVLVSVAAIVSGLVVATYFNAFVLVVQLFRPLPDLNQLAPTQSEPPFAIVQVLVLAIFVWLGASADAGVRSATARR